MPFRTIDSDPLDPGLIDDASPVYNPPPANDPPWLDPGAQPAPAPDYSSVFAGLSLDAQSFLVGTRAVSDLLTPADAARGLGRGNVVDLANSSGTAGVADQARKEETFFGKLQKQLDDVIGWTDKHKNATALLGGGALALLSQKKSARDLQVVDEHYRRVDATNAGRLALDQEKYQNIRSSGAKLNVKGLPGLINTPVKGGYIDRRKRNTPAGVVPTGAPA